MRCSLHAVKYAHVYYFEADDRRKSKVESKAVASSPIKYKENLPSLSSPLQFLET